MELEGSMLCSQELSNGPYPRPDQSSPYILILSKIQFFLSIHPRLGFPTGLLVFPRVSLLIGLDLIILIILDKEYRLWSS
jgi:hypothetical protein